MDSTDDSPLWRAAFSDVPQGSFRPMPKTRPGMWLAEHKELGQSFKAFLQKAPVGRPHSYVDTMHVLPVGQFDSLCAPDLGQLVDYAQRFFCCKVALLEPIPVSAVAVGLRDGAEGQPQLHAAEIIDYIAKMRKPRESFACIAVTMVDIYPRPEWNFVFGLARAADASGVYSFARYDPDDAFFSERTRRALTPAERSQLMQRCCKVFTHETSHVLGMSHCIAGSCLMNGSNHLEESDGKPMHLCPACLRKLRGALPAPGFDPVTRYQALAEACERMGIAEAAWFRRRAEALHAIARASPAAVAAPAAPAAPAGAGAGSGRGGRTLASVPLASHRRSKSPRVAGAAGAADAASAAKGGGRSAHLVDVGGGGGRPKPRAVAAPRPRPTVTVATLTFGAARDSVGGVAGQYDSM